MSVLTRTILIMTIVFVSNFNNISFALDVEKSDCNTTTSDSKRVLLTEKSVLTMKVVEIKTNKELCLVFGCDVPSDIMVGDYIDIITDKITYDNNNKEEVVFVRSIKQIDRCE